jgi:hypothetical protein
VPRQPITRHIAIAPIVAVLAWIKPDLVVGVETMTGNYR